MSAYMLQDQTFRGIGAFVTLHTKASRPGYDNGVWHRVIRKGRCVKASHIEAQEVINILAAENRRSVNFRYNERLHIPKIMAGGEADAPCVAVFRRMLDCYEYQACERPGFYASEAFYLLGELRALALEVATKNVGDDASWGSY